MSGAGPYLAFLVLWTLILGAVYLVIVNQINATHLETKLTWSGGGLGKFARVLKLHKKHYPSSWLRISIVVLTVLGWGFIFLHEHRENRVTSGQRVQSTSR